MSALATERGLVSGVMVGIKARYTVCNGIEPNNLEIPCCVYRMGDLLKYPLKSRDIVPKNVLGWAGVGGVGWVMNSTSWVGRGAVGHKLHMMGWGGVGHKIDRVEGHITEIEQLLA